MATARSRRKLRGKPTKLSPAQVREVRRMPASGDYPVTEIAGLFRVSRPTIYRALQRAAASAELPADTRPLPTWRTMCMSRCASGGRALYGVPVKPAQVLRSAALGLMAAAAASTAYQEFRAAQDRRRYPPPGQLVDIGGRRLHMLATASRPGPPVVIVPALSGEALDWLAIQRVLAPDVPVILYDRGGLGWSDPAPGPRTVGVMADELHDLLTSAAIEPPYVMAGHSLGGLVALLYTARHRDRVAGLALLESSHPEMAARMPRKSALSLSIHARWLLIAARRRATPLGLVRLADDLGVRTQATAKANRWYPADVAAAGRAHLLSSRHRRTVVSELVNVRRSCADASAAMTGLGNLPLAVVVCSERGSSFRSYATWRDLQAEFAKLSTDSTFTVLPGSGHNLYLDNPDVVTAALRDLAKRASR